MSGDRSKNGAVFSHFAGVVARTMGRPAAFGFAVAFVVVWGLTGPVFRYSDTWQLVINTATTIITFLMVFLIQHTQNRDTLAIQLKLDELIRVMRGAENAFVDLEDLSEAELDALRTRFVALAERSRQGESAPRKLPGRSDEGGRPAARRKARRKK